MLLDNKKVNHKYTLNVNIILFNSNAKTVGLIFVMFKGLSLSGVHLV